MTCAHRHVERVDYEVYKVCYDANPATGEMDVETDRTYMGELSEFGADSSWYRCHDCGAETSHYDELTGEWEDDREEEG